MRSALFAVLLCTAGAAAAAPGIDARQARQDARIAAGQARGELTPCETARLLRRTDRIAAREAAYCRHGGLGPHERRDLHHRLDHVSADIARQRRDGRRCF